MNLHLAAIKGKHFLVFLTVLCAVFLTKSSQTRKMSQCTHEPTPKPLGLEPNYGPEQIPWSQTLSDMASSQEGDLLVSRPVGDPLENYADVNAHVTGKYYQVPSKGLTEEQQEAAQKETRKLLQVQKSTSIGYQTNNHLPGYRKTLAPHLEFMSNNIGDPYEPGSFTMNTKWMECNVLDYYASLWNARWPYKLEDQESYWGYVLTMGSTEGNLYAAWNARDYLSGKYMFYDPDQLSRALVKSIRDKLVSVPQSIGYAYAQAKLRSTGTEYAFEPLVFYSEDTHYSNIKATQTIDIPTFATIGEQRYPGMCPLEGYTDWPTEVPSKDGSLGPGTIDIDALITLAEFFVQRGYPIYVVLNYGSTFKGVYDHVEEVAVRLEKLLRDNNMWDREIEVEGGETETRRGFWLHVDGALGASYMPFVEMAAKNNIRPGLEPGPIFDFRLEIVSSIVTSGHKWPGSPWPSGVFMTRNKYRIKSPSGTPTYVGAPDTTFAGSRNATSAAIFWTYISTHSYDKQVKKVLDCLDVVNYAHSKLLKLQVDLQQDLWITHSNPLSLTIHLKRPNEEISYKYSLSNEDLLVNGTEKRTYAHIYFMENVTFALVDQLIADLHTEGAIPEQNPTAEAASMLQWVRNHRRKFANREKTTPLRHVPILGRSFK